MSSILEMQKADSLLEELYAKIPHKKQVFIKEYLNSFNISAASKKAGYSSRQNGFRMMTNDDNVKKIIEIEKAKLNVDNFQRKYKLLRSLDRIRRLSINEKKYSSALRAVDLEARISGIYKDELRINLEDMLEGHGQTAFERLFPIEEMSRGELEELENIFEQVDQLSSKVQENKTDISIVSKPHA